MAAFAKQDPSMTQIQFGIYAASQVGRAIGKPDDRMAIDRLVALLQGAKPFIIREYLHYLGPSPDPEKVATLNPNRELNALTMPDAWYAENRRRLDLVLSYIPEVRAIDGWLAFIDQVVRRYGYVARFLQITLEPNFNISWIDGSSPGVVDALVHGVGKARGMLDSLSLGDVEIGFSVAEPQEWLGGDTAFWAALSNVPQHEFADLVDYVGLGLYPDAFSPVAPLGSPGDIVELTVHAIRHLREVSMPMARLAADIPIHISENGSPTGAHRSQRDQVASLSSMIETVVNISDRCNITAYELFGLRDANTGGSDAISQFGIVDDRYEPKAAFDIYKRLIAAYGVSG
jgi:hypothetical protein